MKGVLATLAALLIAAAGLVVGYTLRGTLAPTSQASEEGEKKEAEKTAKVKTEPLREAAIEKTVVAYGTVVATPEDIQSVSVPFEARVVRVFVAPGQSVDVGDPMCGSHAALRYSYTLSTASLAT